MDIFDIFDDRGELFMSATFCSSDIFEIEIKTFLPEELPDSLIVSQLYEDYEIQ